MTKCINVCAHVPRIFLFSNKVLSFSGDPKKQLITAAENNDLEIVRRLLSEDASLISSRDNDQYSALHRAAYSGHYEMAEVKR